MCGTMLGMTEQHTTGGPRLDIRKYGPAHTAKELGVSVDTLKRWEAAGIIPKAHRTAGGHRRYSQDDIRAIEQRIAANQKAWN